MSERKWEVVAWDNGAQKPITWRIWCSLPVRKVQGIGYHISTVHYKTREAAEKQVAKYQQMLEVVT